ncbi:amino acid permease [Acrocarpospora catenulata]|uniref:amino acid permease n=1 Tax=Acrocarpospora catenulata TaxID=2836182 RepID=UPI001BDA63DE|nr:amino acid permease [Acrocarpospora catenulata]
MPATEATVLRTAGLREIYTRNDLIVLGLGVMIGAGIFSIAGRQAATTAGPGVILSFMIAGITSLLAAICYAEMVSTMPVSGSAYTYTYVIFGEVWAWIIGWSLILEMELAAAMVARVWSLYMTQMLTDLGFAVPELLSRPVGFDLFTLLILVTLTGIVAFNAKVGLRTLWVLVSAKMVGISAVILIGALHFNPANIAEIPVDPVNTAAQATAAEPLQSTVFGLLIGETHAFGWFGILAATPAIAFAYLGFDIVATAAEETKDAVRTVPQGMIRALATATVIYILVAVVMVGMVSYKEISLGAPLADAFRAVGETFMVHVINLTGMLGLTTVVYVLLVGQTRVLFSMARDGLLPTRLSRLSGPHRTPATATLFIGVVAILLAELVPVLLLEQLVVIGTLFAFMIVSAGVISMRRTMPDLPRGFRVPLSPLVPAMSIVATLWLMLNLKVVTWLYFVLWMAVGVLVYQLYGRRHSALAPTIGRHRRPTVPRRD